MDQQTNEETKENDKGKEKERTQQACPCVHSPEEGARGNITFAGIGQVCAFQSDSRAACPLLVNGDGLKVNTKNGSFFLKKKRKEKRVTVCQECVVHACTCLIVGVCLQRIRRPCQHVLRDEQRGRESDPQVELCARLLVCLAANCHLYIWK